MHRASSSSSSSSSSSTADDNYINNRTNNRMSDVASFFSSLHVVGSHHRRHGAGSTDHQHLTDNDVVQAPSRSISTPHVLPLPKLSALLKRRESVDNEKLKHVLPSPEEANKKSGESRGISDANHRDSKSLGSLNRSRTTQHKESQFLQKWPQGFTSTAGSRDGYTDGETVSAPTSPILSQAAFQPASKMDMSPGIQLWSALETPLRDITQGVAYHYHTTPQRSIHDFDGSVVHNTEKRTRVKSPMQSSSPLHKKILFESTMSRPDSNAQATMTTVHPLPLPPGVAGLPPSSPPQASKRPDFVADTPRKRRWKKGKLIGRGTFGSVYVGSNRETGALCAMKEVEILPDDPKSAESIKQLQQEIGVLSQLKHPNIVQYYGSEIVEDRLYIYLEYVHPGSINKYVRDHCGGMTESIVRNFTRHIVSGLAYLHSKKTIHRDIKGANLLVDANGVVKLADFGMAKHLDGQVNLSLKGSPYWMAPELLQGKPQKDGNPDLALAVDIWSLGCTIIEMMNGKPPWSEHEGPAAMFKVMKETPPIPETLSPDGKDFLRCCFIRNPAERPTAIMLLEHKFLMVQNRRAHSR